MQVHIHGTCTDQNTYMHSLADLTQQIQNQELYNKRILVTFIEITHAHTHIHVHTSILESSIGLRPITSDVAQAKVKVAMKPSRMLKVPMNDRTKVIQTPDTAPTQARVTSV